MRKALGLVEVKGLVGAIEAADAMLKAANVSFAGKERVDPAMITVKVLGDTAAVRAAVDAGAEAAKRVGQLISVHIIPQPDEQISKILPELLREKSSGSPEISESLQHKKDDKVFVKDTHAPAKPEEHEQVKSGKPVTESVEPIAKKEIVKEISVQKKTPPAQKIAQSESLFDSSSDTISRLRREALGMKKEEKVEEKPASPKEVDLTVTDGAELPMSEIEGYNVHELRRLARSTEAFPIQGREISRANRKQLVDYFRQIKS